MKTVRDLKKELEVRDCFLNVLDGTLVRMVQPVFIKLKYGDKILVNSKDIYLHRVYFRTFSRRLNILRLFHLGSFLS